MRTKITLVCTECKRRNYDTMKEKKNTPDRLELNKHCPFFRKHTLHRESKKSGFSFYQLLMKGCAFNVGKEKTQCSCLVP